jgi:alpha-glucuronidase
LGFDRTASGSNELAQYAPAVRERWASLATVPDSFLLWFHHVPWGYRMRDGRTLWQSLVDHYDAGVDTVRMMRRTWASLAGHVDTGRYAETRDFLAIQEREARWWRDAVLAYFQTFSRMPIVSPLGPPTHSLAYYEQLTCPADPRKPRCAGVP